MPQKNQIECEAQKNAKGMVAYRDSRRIIELLFMERSVQYSSICRSPI